MDNPSGYQDGMDLGDFAQALDKFSDVMVNAFADAGRSAMVGFWKEFKAQIPFRGRTTAPPGQERPPLKSPQAWPIQAQGATLDTLEVRMFSNSEAAKLHEFGGTVRPKQGSSIAIPIGAARTRTGGVKPYYSKPEKRRARGDEFLLIKRDGVRYLHKLVPVKKRKRGRPRKDAKGIPLRPSAAPYFLLLDSVDVQGRLGFYATWRRYWPTAVYRWGETVQCAINLLLGKPVPSRCRRWLERRGGSLEQVNRAA